MDTTITYKNAIDIQPPVLAARYPTLIADNRHMQAVGLERWLKEQKERVWRGLRRYLLHCSQARLRPGSRKADISPEFCICDGCLAFEGRNCGQCSESKIRACGIERKVLNCAHCEDYACEKLEDFFGFAPDAKATLDEVKQSL